ncbi:response regulator transcription factor [Limisphaera ngatamarikiensis]|jgi:DNA-binding NarL/FixJ family response regulator|uniref:Response regulator transcription factor n=1 Tax=Limisphaera ngatamarikiensis TaxID=1324935 RepID=A0A6M1RR13_9BACT|nr:response regulator transcription factor [Limisphaera ngatamarikiensis]NGO37874.1 response regulator transcription factor [Limisphaera ngatamarikiensis]
MNTTIPVAIVEDDDGVRAKLVQAINRFKVCRCVGDYATAEQALEQLPLVKPRVVLMDIHLPGLSGIECVRRLKPAHPDIEFIMLTVYEDTDTVFSALAAGASGYLLKQATREELLEAIQQVHDGGSPMTSHIARKVVQSFRQPTPPGADLPGLTTREQQVLELLAKGYIYKEIAAMLNISYATVHNHIRHIYNKLQVRSRTQAVAKYLGREPTASRGQPPQNS